MLILTFLIPQPEVSDRTEDFGNFAWSGDSSTHFPKGKVVFHWESISSPVADEKRFFLTRSTQVKKGTITPTAITCILVICATVIICAVVIALFVQRMKRQALMSKKEAKSPSEETWEVKREDVAIGAELGHGCFGTVYKGTLKDPMKVK